MPRIVTHGFEPVHDKLDNVSLVRAYRRAGMPIDRVLVREPLGTGIVSGARLSAARVTLDGSDRGIERATSLLARLAAVRPPQDMDEAAAVARIRELCRNALRVLGEDAAVLHGVSCRQECP